MPATCRRSVATMPTKNGIDKRDVKMAVAA